MSIIVSEVSKQFGEVRALDRVSLECLPGQVLGLLGPNGAGKTTLLRIMATMLRPTAGGVTVMGHDTMSAAAEVRKSTGYISVDTGLYERLSPLETVSFFGRLNEVSEGALAQRISAVFEMLNIVSFQNKRNAQLSSGMRQKVSLARAIIHDPPVLIFDEPTASLDVLAAHAVEEFIHQSREQDKCIVYAGHNMDEAQRICTHAAFIDQGRIIGGGSVPELVADEEGGLNAVFFNMMKGSTAGART